MRARAHSAALVLAVCAAAHGGAVAQSGAPEVQAPGLNVPAQCAAFSGGWSGDWPRVGRIYLWVMSVEPDCSAQVIYGRSAKPTAADKTTTATIRNETLTLPRPDGGSTIFDHKGSAVMGRYRGPAGFNESLMERVGFDAAARLDAEQRAQAAMVPLPADLPTECAALHGQWVGTWSQGNWGEQFLRVVEVKAAGGHCTARYSYSASRSPVAAKDTADVRGGAMAFDCNASTGGTCVFKPAGSELDASYTNPGGGRNSATFRRLP